MKREYLFNCINKIANWLLAGLEKMPIFLIFLATKVKNLPVMMMMMQN